MDCPNCGTPEMIIDLRDIQVSYKDLSATVKDVSGLFCVSCGEAVLGKVSCDKIDKALLELKQRQA